jgi:hypothetical protein
MQKKQDKAYSFFFDLCMKQQPCFFIDEKSEYSSKELHRHLQFVE